MPSSGQSLGPRELYELGNRLLDAGNLEQAGAAYYECLKLSPESAIAALGLARASRDLGKHDIAVRVLETALRFNPKDGRILSTLGAAYEEAGDHRRAMETLEAALALDGQNFDAAFNLGNTHQGLGDHAKALSCYRMAVDMTPSDGAAFYNLGMVLLYSEDERSTIAAFERAAGDGWPGLAASVMLALILYLDGAKVRSAELLQHTASVTSLAETGDHRNDIRNTKAYHRYLAALLSRPPITPARVLDTLHVIGDSHVFGLKDAVEAGVHWVLGCKQWHLGNPDQNKYKRKFASIIERLPSEATVLLSIGEIDCRLGGGIFEVWKKEPGRSLEEVVLDTVRPYVDYVARYLRASGRRIILCGVPAALARNLQGLSAGEQRTYTGMMRFFNASLRDLGRAAGMGFLDLHALTDTGNGKADGSWHIDAVHLLPEAYTEAFRNHYLPAK